MRLNKSFLLNTALTIALSTVTAFSANAKEVNNYARDHINGSHTEVKLALAKDSYETEHQTQHNTKSSEPGFISKHTTELEFTFAILIVIGGIILSERFQRQQEQLATEESNERKH